MTALNLQPNPESNQSGDKRLAVPQLPESSMLTGIARKARIRRRYSVTQLAQPRDDGFRPFRIY